MSDVDDIAALVHSYARLVDGGDVDAVVALFEHCDVAVVAHGSSSAGPAE